MHITQLTQLDLNLLVVLQVLLEERKVSAAAKRLALSQSATSRALGRLRLQLGDELFVRADGKMMPTARAQQMAPELRRILDGVHSLVNETDAVDPKTLARTFKIATADYALTVLMPQLLSALAQRAPGVQLAVQPLSDGLRDLETGELDFIIKPKKRAPAGTVWTPLLEDRFLTIVRDDHPLVGERLSLARFCKLAHLVVAPEYSPQRSAVDRYLRNQGRERSIALRVPSFLAAPMIVAESDLVATVPARVAERVVGRLPIRAVPTPVPLPALRLALAWNERSRADGAHRWFRRLLHDVAEAL